MALAKEWGRYKVNVNTVAFGYIATRLTEATDEKKEIEIEGRRIGVGVPSGNVAALARAVPLGRGGTTDEAAGSIILFCLPEADYVSGPLLEVTGGL